MWWLLTLLWAQAGAAPAPPPIPVGKAVPSVTCLADPTKSYALYLPSGYTPLRTWPVIFAFDPGARGATAVDRYQAAAEQYGFIVAGSNNSRNGMPDVTPAISAMTTDVITRFHVNEKRVYTAGMSGGARLALAVALSSPSIAGVIASSAGYPDSKPRKTVPFPIFATAGTEDFNHLELRELDAALTSPHHLTVFEGGHVWLSSALATEAVEWMEVMAMKTGTALRDRDEVEAIFAKRVAAASAESDRARQYTALAAIATDFEGLRDVSEVAAKAAALGRDSKVRDALRRDRDEDARERRTLMDIFQAQALLATDDRDEALMMLRSHWKDLSARAQKPQDSADRRFARRVLSNLGASTSTTDQDYLKIIAQYRLARQGGPR